MYKDTPKKFVSLFWGVSLYSFLEKHRKKVLTFTKKCANIKVLHVLIPKNMGIVDIIVYSLLSLGNG